MTVAGFGFISIPVSLFQPRPDGVIADTNLEDASGGGVSAISPISVEKVVRSSCAIHAARRSQRHCVQYSISIRGVLCMTAVQFRAHRSRPKGARSLPISIRSLYTEAHAFVEFKALVGRYRIESSVGTPRR